MDLKLLKSNTKVALLEFLGILKDYLTHTIKANKRADNMYHAYNLMTVSSDNQVSISRLPEMLEGQVALSAGMLTPKRLCQF
jgi:hypothetical protein